MINICSPGDKQTHSFSVTNEHFPEFQGKVVHKVCSTYVLAREIEWSTRQFVLEMLQEDEEGVGTMLTIDHESPALEGDEIIIEATVETMNGNELICSFTAICGNRLIARGKTGQRILKKEKLNQIISDINK